MFWLIIAVCVLTFYPCDHTGSEENVPNMQGRFDNVFLVGKHNRKNKIF